MDKARFGIAFVAVVALAAGIAAWAVVERQKPSAEAAVTEACSNIELADSFTVTVRHDFEGNDYNITEGRFSGAKYHLTTRYFYDGVEYDVYSESIYDGEGTKYWRKSTGEWQSTAMNRKDPFPFSRESLCPDLDSIGSVAFQGEETIGGVVLRRYALDTTGFDWLVWIDSEGWLSQVRMVRLDPGAAAAGETAAEGLDITASISGRGEANTVTIPQVGQ